MNTNKVSALDSLRALAQKKPGMASPSLTIQVTDPAIAGAKRDKSVVRLGFDPSFHDKAAYCSKLKVALDRATTDYEIMQAELRDYGSEKRKLYNDTFKTNITTVAVPFQVETPEGQETKFVNVICSNRYSVQKDMILNNFETLGEWRDRLFKVEVVKKLKPNAEELIRNVFQELGMEGEALEGAMASLFETETKISAAEDFESQETKAPDVVRSILSQAVSRCSPALKFT